MDVLLCLTSCKLKGVVIVLNPSVSDYLHWLKKKFFLVV